MLKFLAMVLVGWPCALVPAQTIRVHNLTTQPVVAGIFYTHKEKFCPGQGTAATVYIVEKYSAQDIAIPPYKHSIVWTLVVTPPGKTEDKISYMRDFVNGKSLEVGDAVTLGTEPRNFYVINPIVEISDEKHGATKRKVRKIMIQVDKALSQLNEDYKLNLPEELLKKRYSEEGDLLPRGVPVKQGFSFVIEEEQPQVEVRRSRGSTIVQSPAVGAGHGSRGDQQLGRGAPVAQEETKRVRSRTVTQGS